MIQGLIYSVISAIAFGMLAVLVKMGYAVGLGGAEMMQYRFTFAVLILLVVILFKDPSLLRISLSGLLKCAFIGLVVYGAQTTCFVKALETIPASTTALILYVYPVTVTLLSVVFFKLKITRVMAWALALVMAGCCLVFYDAFLNSVDSVGLMYAAGAMIIFSCYLILVQKMLSGVRPLSATFYVMIFAAVTFTATGDPALWLELTMDKALIGLALGVIPGVIAVGFLYTAVEKIGGAYTSIFSSIEPVATLVAAHYFIGEDVVPLQVAGAVLIVGGIILPNAKLLRTMGRIEAEN